jgi:hypothetical protein
MVVNALSTNSSLVPFWKNEWDGSAKLLGLGHLEIQERARVLSEVILSSEAISVVEKVRASLYLGAMTRDVNHLLDAMA